MSLTQDVTDLVNADFVALIHSRCVEDGDCLIWTGRVDDKSGLPLIYHEGRNNISVRRLLYAALHGVAPAARVITPICGHKLCLCESHLHAVTPKRSKELAAARGAYQNPAKVRRGVATRNAKSWITEEVIEQVKEAPSARAAAKETGMSVSYAKALRNGTARRDYSSPFVGLGARA